MKWNTLEYVYKTKGADWYWGLGLATLAGAAAAVYFSNILLAIIIVLSAVLLAMFGVRKPHQQEVEIDTYGVRVDTIFYPFSNLESFCIHTNYAPPRLFLKSKSLLAPHIVISIEEYHPEEVYNLLEQYLVMEEMHESIFHNIFEYLGF